MDAKILSVTLALLLLGFIIELVRREKLTFKYASTWILACLAGLLMAFFDAALARVSGALGFVLLSNFVFFVMFCVFVFLSLLLTMFLCQQNRRNDRMAQKIALLEDRLEQLEQRG